MRASRPVVAFAVASLFVGACSSSGGSAGTPTGGSGAAGGGIFGGASQGTVPPCFSAADVGSALGITVSEPTSSGGSGSEICRYPPTTGVVPVTMELQVTSIAVFQGAIPSMNGVTPLSGIGDAAYTQDPKYVGEEQNVVYAYAKGIEITVMAVATVDQISSLVKAIIAKL